MGRVLTMRSLFSKSVFLSAVAMNLVLSYQPMSFAKTITLPLADIPTSTPEEIRLEVKLSHQKVTLYRGTVTVKSYPIAIGRTGWETPTGNFQILQTIKNPVWKNPFTGETVPANDPDNPLGNYWIGFTTKDRIWYGFHGTSDRASIGKAVSHGCLRMYNQDIKELFSQVRIGTEVNVIP